MALRSEMNTTRRIVFMFGSSVNILEPKFYHLKLPITSCDLGKKNKYIVVNEDKMILEMFCIADAANIKKKLEEKLQERMKDATLLLCPERDGSFKEAYSIFEEFKSKIPCPHEAIPLKRKYLRYFRQFMFDDKGMAGEAGGRFIQVMEGEHKERREQKAVGSDGATYSRMFKTCPSSAESKEEKNRVKSFSVPR